MRKSHLSRALGAAVLMLGVMAAPAGGGVGTTYNVQVGAFYSEDLPAVGNNFYPEQMQVHPAEQLNFASGGFHTATLLPLGEDPDAWFAANAASPDDPFFFREPRPR
ncbi:MAG: hypothetical protein ACRDLB_03930 [Actinomycetota bacterium]